MNFLFDIFHPRLYNIMNCIQNIKQRGGNYVEIFDVEHTWNPWGKVLGKRGISIITKLTGLFLSAIAAGMILEGIKNFFAVG